MIQLLLAGLIMSIPSIDALEGGDFSAAVVDLQTGEELESTGSGAYPLNDPDVFMLAYVVELMQEGVISPETVVGRDETLAQRFRMAFRGNREAAGRAMWTVGLETLSAWVAENGMNDTELHDVQLAWEGAPETDPSLSSVQDLARALSIIHSGMDMGAVGQILEDPDMGQGHASEVGSGCDLYGWTDQGEDHKTFVLMAIFPDGRELGLILLSDDLCCPEKGDMAMMLLWNLVSYI